MQPPTWYNESMSIFISVIILVLVMAIQLMLQLNSGVFALFYHYALGKLSRRKADDLSLYYVLGTEVFVGGIWLIIYIFLFNMIGDAGETVFRILPWVLVGVCVAEAVMGLVFYYRKGKMTELFVPRAITRGISTKVKDVKTRLDAFVLGFVVGAFELIFSLPLYLAASTVLMESPEIPRALVIILYIVLATMPLFVTRILFRTDHNLAEIEKKRVKHKSLVRLFMFILYMAVALLMVYIGIKHG